MSHDCRRDCAFLFKLADGILEADANAHLAEHGITIAQARYLEYIESRGGSVAMKDIEGEFGVSQPTVAGVVKRLSVKGFVEVSVSKEDRRAKTAAITEKGMGVLSFMSGRRPRVEEHVLSPLDDSEKEVFKDMLERVCANLLENRRS